MNDDDLEQLGEEFEAVWDANHDILYRDDDDDDIEPAPFQPGDRVYVAPAKLEATVIRQIRHYDGPESWWGNLELLYDDGIKGKCHCWQVKRV
jgi:hypothetical protein